MVHRRYTFVTVVHAIDSALLLLQARSMRMYCPDTLIEAILLIENVDRGRPIWWRQRLLAEYGHLAPLVPFIPAEYVARVPMVSGWLRQQVHKIAVSSVVPSDRYLILDAKNHLVTPLTRDYLETPEGAPRIGGRSFHSDGMRPFFERSLRYVGLNPEAYLSFFPRTTTPFTMVTAEARGLVDFVERREQRAFSEVFIKVGAGEFFLYSAWLARHDRLYGRYVFHQPGCPGVWGNATSDIDVRRTIASAADRSQPFFASHRRALRDVSAAAVRMIAEFWFERGLFGSVEAGVEFAGEVKRLQGALAP